MKHTSSLRLILAIFVLLISTSAFSQPKSGMALSDSLFAVGVDLYKAGKYREAIPYFTQSDSIDKAVLDSTSNRRDYSAMWLASCYYHIGDSVTAEGLSDYYRLPPVDRRLTVKSDSLSNLGVIYCKDKKYELALSCFLKGSDIEKNILGEGSVWLGNTQSMIATLCVLMGDTINAIKYCQSSYEIMKNNYAVYPRKVLNALNKLGDLYLNYSMYDKAESCYVELYNCADSIEDRHNFAFQIANRYYQKGHSQSGCEERENYEKALTYLALSDSTTKSVADFNKFVLLEMAASFNTEALRLEKQGNYSEAIRLGNEALKIRGSILGKKHPDYAMSLNNLALNYSHTGKFFEAYKLGLEVLSIIEQSPLGKRHPAYAISLANLAEYNNDLGNCTEAIRLGSEVIDIRKNLQGIKHPDYAMALNNLALYYSNAGNCTEAIRLGTDALYIMEKSLGKCHLLYTIILGNLANFYSMVGNYEEAIRQGGEVISIQRQVLGEMHPIYAKSLSNLANYNECNGNYEEAIRLGIEALNIRANTIGMEHPDYANSLSNLANYNADKGNFREAIRLGKLSLEINAKIVGIKHPDYANVLNNLAGYNYFLENYDDAIRLETEALDIREKIYGEIHPINMVLLQNLYVFYAAINNQERLEAVAAKYLSCTLQILKQNFADLTASDRPLFWAKYKNWYEVWAHKFALEHPSPSLFACGYDAVLTSKGLLLNSDIAFRTLVQESGDAKVLALYDEMNTLRRQADKLREKPVAERPMDVDSLENVAKGIEQELLSTSKVYGDYTHNLVITWQQVQEKLGKRDAAVEFVAFPVSADSVMYTAYVLRKGMKSPEMVQLFEEKELKAIPESERYTGEAVGTLVWKPLENRLKGCNHIWFSPAGELYNIAIEYVPYAANAVRSLHRLSSTRELALIKPDNKANSAAVYGGLRYDMNAGELEKNSLQYPHLRGCEAPFAFGYDIADSIAARGNRKASSARGVAYLKGTKAEAENVLKSLGRMKVNAAFYTDTIGTEASFKALSGRRTKLMYIGTHGFYNTEREWAKYNPESDLSLNGSRPRLTEDKALTRSGLYMAGVNAALRREKIPEGVDDGILTAKEIAGLDLRGLDFVVLSACQTGLGDVTGDGVFGLQRGFKKAGAQTILMSLWPVEDNATQLLMSRFFDNMASGQSKYDALKDAQRYLREYKTDNEDFEPEHPYDDPLYWAAFVLLDADV